MQRNLTTTEFAKEVGINRGIVRRLIIGTANKLTAKNLDILSKGLGMSVQEIQRREKIPPAQMPQTFAAWLSGKPTMTTPQIRAIGVAFTAMRNYYSGHTLPSAPNARALALFYEESFDFIAGLVVWSYVDTREKDLLAYFRRLENDRQTKVLEIMKNFLEWQNVRIRDVNNRET